MFHTNVQFHYRLKERIMDQLLQKLQQLKIADSTPEFTVSDTIFSSYKAETEEYEPTEDDGMVPQLTIQLGGTIFDRKEFKSFVTIAKFNGIKLEQKVTMRRDAAVLLYSLLKKIVKDERPSGSLTCQLIFGYRVRGSFDDEEVVLRGPWSGDTRLYLPRHVIGAVGEAIQKICCELPKEEDDGEFRFSCHAHFHSLQLSDIKTRTDSCVTAIQRLMMMMMTEDDDFSFSLKLDIADDVHRASISKTTTAANETSCGLVSLTKQQVVGLLALIYADEASSFNFDGTVTGICHYADSIAIYVVENETKIVAMSVPHNNVDSLRLILETACLLLPNN